VQFVGVAWSGDTGEYTDFVDRYGLSFPQIDDTAADVFTRFGVAYQPAIAIVLPDGEVQTIAGAVDEESLDAILGAAA
jgi:hypothetical protein